MSNGAGKFTENNMLCYGPLVSELGDRVHGAGSGRERESVGKGRRARLGYLSRGPRDLSYATGPDKGLTSLLGEQRAMNDVNFSRSNFKSIVIPSRNNVVVGFYPRDAMLARVLAMAWCLSVCVRVCHKPVFCRTGRTH